MQIARKVSPKVKTLVYFRFIGRPFVRIYPPSGERFPPTTREEDERNSFSEEERAFYKGPGARVKGAEVMAQYWHS